MSPQMTEAEAPRPPLWRRMARWILGLIAVGLLIAALIAEWSDVSSALTRLSPTAVVIAQLLVLVGLAANMLSWRSLMGALGSPLPVPDASRVFLLAQVGKYLPGSVWPVLAQIELGRDRGIPRSRSAIAAVVALLVGLIVGSVVAAVLVGPLHIGGALGWAAIAAVLPGLVLIVRPRLLETLIRFVLRVARRGQDGFTIDARGLRHTALWSLVMWLALGAHVFVLLREFSDTGVIRLLLLSIGAYASAWVVGLLVVFAPAGAGPREAALVWALSSAVSRPEALALAVVSRVLTILGDGLCVVAVLASRRGRPDPATTGEGPVLDQSGR